MLHKRTGQMLHPSKRAKEVYNVEFLLVKKDEPSRKPQTFSEVSVAITEETSKQIVLVKYGDMFRRQKKILK